MVPLLMVLAADTVRVTRAEVPPEFDGLIGSAEYAAPTLELSLPAGSGTIWLRRDDEFVYLAARIPDSTSSSLDGLTVALDTRGDRAAGPMHDDFEWEFRRVLDSSVVYRGEAGHWRAPRDDPDWRLGAEREGGGWEVRARSSGGEWTLELRFDIAYFRQAAGLPGLALLLFDDQGQTWTSWPATPGRRQASTIMHNPSGWAAVVLQ